MLLFKSRKLSFGGSEIPSLEMSLRRSVVSLAFLENFAVICEGSYLLLLSVDAQHGGSTKAYGCDRVESIDSLGYCYTIKATIYSELTVERLTRINEKEG
ncbi:unnamed protein product [Cylicostephanus goldi]|uniref:Uncharacterized protein n=1 Tax=Cylicostephanus goldi TaxID=71465 RepID=A0A3P7NQ28_CYLGO|nr:unnamed protein product [Cylicostephanus goldi]